MVKSNNKKVAAKIVKLKKPSKAQSLTKELMERAVRHIAEEILAVKPTADGRTPRGFADKLLKEAKETFPKLSMNKINCAIKKMKEGLKKGSVIS
jgi:recombinational DNA repair protein RecR